MIVRLSFAGIRCKRLVPWVRMCQLHVVHFFGFGWNPLVLVRFHTDGKRTRTHLQQEVSLFAFSRNYRPHPKDGGRECFQFVHQGDQTRVPLCPLPSSLPLVRTGVLSLSLPPPTSQDRGTPPDRARTVVQCEWYASCVHPVGLSVIERGEIWQISYFFCLSFFFLHISWQVSSVNTHS